MILPRKLEDWPNRWREQYEERAAIVEYLANFPRYKAEIMAEQEIRKLAQEAQWEPLS